MEGFDSTFERVNRFVVMKIRARRELRPINDRTNEEVKRARSRIRGEDEGVDEVKYLLKALPHITTVYRPVRDLLTTGKPE